MEQLRIILADDHAMLREGLAALLDAEPDLHVVAHAHDGPSALAQCATWHPDILVLDLSMPGGNGLDMIDQITTHHPPMRIVVLTRHTEVGYLQRAMAAGAHGYVLKQSMATTVLSAIRTVATGTPYLDPVMARQYAQHEPQHATPPQRAMLSPREDAVLRSVAHGHTLKEISAALGLSVKTVNTYKARAMDKLGLAGRTALTQYARVHGWIDTSA